MKIALVTPWPPLKTGIADYAYDLASGLSEAGHEVIVFTTADKPLPLEGVGIEPCSALTPERAALMDHVVYQMGNNSSFHLHMIPMMETISGVVHLHDMVLHHLMAFALYAQGDHRLYRRTLAKWYGPHIAKLFMDKAMQGEALWDQPAVTDVPFFEEAMLRARSCIVHSQFAKKKIKAVFPHLDVGVVQQVYPPVLATPSIHETFRIGVFGGVDPQKRVDSVLYAAARAKKRGAMFEIHVEGGVNPMCEWLEELAEEIDIHEQVIWHGRVDGDAFNDLLASMDLCMGLRYPTMGETSAVVMRALKMGIPSVVSDIGWYAELPSFVVKVDPTASDEIETLATVIEKMAQRGALYHDCAAQTRQYAQESLNFNEMIETYVALLEGQERVVHDQSRRTGSQRA